MSQKSNFVTPQLVIRKLILLTFKGPSLKGAFGKTISSDSPFSPTKIAII